MTQPPIHTLSPPELRGYARGLRTGAARVEQTFKASLFTSSVTSLADATRAAWQREAELVEGFAARLDAVEAALAEAQRDQPEEFRISPDDMAELESMLPPSAEEEEEPAADLGRAFMDASLAWGRRFEAAARRVTAPEATGEEQAQSGLADAVAENLAEQPPTEEPPRTDGRPAGAIWTPERVALLNLLYPTIISQDALCALLNALPGLAIASPQAVRQHAAGLGLRRQGLPLPEGYSDQPITERRRQQMPSARTCVPCQSQMEARRAR